MALDLTARRTRRSLLVGAFGGLTAVATHLLGRPLTAQAGHVGPVRLSHANFGDARTDIVTSGGITAFAAGSGSGDGIFGASDTGNGVGGQSYAGGRGVYGLSGSGPGVYGTSNRGNGVHGHSPTGYGVYGTSDSSYAVTGLSGTSGGVAGFSESGHGAIGVSTTAVGVYGSSGSGRGGRFSGGKAQVRLVPSTSATHPASGEAGDLFVDRARRLWFCKGGTNWKQLA